MSARRAIAAGVSAAVLGLGGCGGGDEAVRVASRSPKDAATVTSPQPTPARAREAFEANLSRVVAASHPTVEVVSGPPPWTTGKGGGVHRFLDSYWDRDAGLWSDPGEPDAALELTWLALQAEAGWATPSAFVYTTRHRGIVEALRRRVQPAGVSAQPGGEPTVRSTVYAARSLTLIERHGLGIGETASKALDELRQLRTPVPCGSSISDIAAGVELRELGIATDCPAEVGRGDDGGGPPLDPLTSDALDLLLDRQAAGIAPTAAALDTIAIALAELAPGDPRAGRLVWRSAFLLRRGGRQIPAFSDTVVDYLASLVITAPA